MKGEIQAPLDLMSQFYSNTNLRENSQTHNANLERLRDIVHNYSMSQNANINKKKKREVFKNFGDGAIMQKSFDEDFVDANINSALVEDKTLQNKMKHKELNPNIINQINVGSCLPYPTFNAQSSDHYNNGMMMSDSSYKSNSDIYHHYLSNLHHYNENIFDNEKLAKNKQLLEKTPPKSKLFYKIAFLSFLSIIIAILSYTLFHYYNKI